MWLIVGVWYGENGFNGVLNNCVVWNCALLWKLSSPHFFCEYVISVVMRYGCDKYYLNWERIIN